MSSKLKPGISEKVQEIKRMQSNWMNQRSASSVIETATSTADTRYGRSRGTRSTAKQPPPKKQDTLTWVVGSGPKAKPSTIRARSASPARRQTADPKPAWGSTRIRPSSGKVGSGVGDGRPPSSGRSAPSNRPPPTTSRSDTSSRKSAHSGSEPDLRSNDSPGSNQRRDASHDCSRTVQSDPSTIQTDQWDFSGGTTADQSVGLARSTVRSEEAVLVLSSQSGVNNSSWLVKNTDAGIRSEGRAGNSDGPVGRSHVRADSEHERSEMLRSVGFTGKSVLDDEDEDGRTLISHKCTKCKQLMVAPDHVPTILIPCGHTLCEACAEDRIKCPVCRARVSSTAVNITLQKVISGVEQNHKPNSPPNHHNPTEYSNHRQCTSNSGSAGPYHSEYQDGRGGPAGRGDRTEVHPSVNRRKKLRPEEQAEKYRDEYQGLLIRCEAAELEEGEILAAMERKNREIGKQKRQISNIANEQDRLREEVRQIEERIAALDVHRREYDDRCDSLEEDKREDAERLAMVRDMLRGLERSKEKVRLLARNVSTELD